MGLERREWKLGRGGRDLRIIGAEKQKRMEEVNGGR